jgi:hypothetical protein
MSAPCRLRLRRLRSATSLGALRAAHIHHRVARRRRDCDLCAELATRAGKAQSSALAHRRPRISINGRARANSRCSSSAGGGGSPSRGLGAGLRQLVGGKPVGRPVPAGPRQPPSALPDLTSSARGGGAAKSICPKSAPVELAALDWRQASWPPPPPVCRLDAPAQRGGAHRRARVATGGSRPPRAERRSGRKSGGQRSRPPRHEQRGSRNGRLCGATLSAVAQSGGPALARAARQRRGSGESGRLQLPSANCRACARRCAAALRNLCAPESANGANVWRRR